MMTSVEYLLTCVSEECAEISQRASKALRFGLEEIQPGHGQNNFERMALELVDLACTLEVLSEQPGISDLDSEALQNTGEIHAKQKLEKIKQYMAYSKSLGILEPCK